MIDLDKLNIGWIEDYDPALLVNIREMIAELTAARKVVEAAEGHDCNMGCRMCSTLTEYRALREAK